MPNKNSAAIFLEFKTSFQAVFLFLISLFWFDTHLCASAQDDAVHNAAVYFKQPFPRQLDVLDSLVDSLSKRDIKLANKALEYLEMAARQNGDEAVWFNYKRSVLRYRYIRTFYSKDTAVFRQLIRDSEELLEEIDENQFPEIAALVHVNIGNSLNYKDINYDLAFDHYLKAYQLFKKVRRRGSKTRHYDLYSIALAYFNFADYQNAITLGNEINKLFPESNPVQCFNRGMLAMAYMELKMYPALLEQASWILVNHKKIGMDPIWGAIGSEDYGYAAFHLGRLEEAEKYFKKSIAIRKQQNKTENFIELYALLSSVYSKTNQGLLAEKYLDSSRNCGRDVREIRDRFQYYESAVDLYRLTGNFSMLSLFQDSLLKAREVIAESKRIHLVHRSEMRVERDKKNQQDEQFRQHKARSEWLRNGFLGIVGFMVLIAGLVFRNFRIRFRYEKVLLTQKNEAMEKELSLARAQLNDFVQLMIEKNQQIRQAEKELEKWKAAEKMEAKEDAENSSEIQSFIRTETIITQDDWNKFSAMFGRAFPGFFERLESRHPELSKAELRYLVLLKLEIPQKDMALILGVGKDAIRQIISRIKRKLHLDSREDFAGLLSG